VVVVESDWVLVAVMVQHVAAVVEVVAWTVHHIVVCSAEEAVDSIAGRIADTVASVGNTVDVPDCRPALLADHPGIVHEDAAAMDVRIAAGVYAVQYAETSAVSVIGKEPPAADIVPSCMDQAHVHIAVLPP